MERETALGLAADFAAAVRQFMQVDGIWVFGPWAAGTAEEDEDIDVAVVAADLPREYTDQDVSVVLWSMAQAVSLSLDPVLVLLDTEESQAFAAKLEQEGIPL